MAWRSSIRDTYSISEYGIERVGLHICFAVSSVLLSTIVVGQIHNEKAAHTNPADVVDHRAFCCHPPITMEQARTRLMRHNSTSPDAGNITMPVCVWLSQSRRGGTSIAK